MSHYHRLQNGSETGPDVVDVDDPIYHYHMVDGERTSNALMKDDHIHELNDIVTSKPIEKEKSAMSKLETKRINGRITEFKEESIDGINVGIVEGYIATWDIDRGDMFGIKDQFVRGAFRESIADHLKRNRMIRFKDHHGRTVGGWKIDTVQEDEIGLFGRAEINLDVQQGKEAMSLIRQKVLTDFSIGFSADEKETNGDLRTITKATIWEGSIVDEPMNPFANVVGFKDYQDIPIAPVDTDWDQEQALTRIAGNKKAFIINIPIADIIDEKLTVIPKALAAAAETVQSEGFPEELRKDATKHIERYYAKMDTPSPFEGDNKQFFVLEDVKTITPCELEKALKRGATFNKSASKFLVAKLKNEKVDDVIEIEDNTEDLKNFIDSVKAITVT